MVIGLIAVCAVAWHVLVSWPDITTGQATRLLLDGIGVGLAAAAVVELAYTLFTEGPDEALDPLMLGLSATILIELGRFGDDASPRRAGALLLLALLLVLLFATRLFLAERHDVESGKDHTWSIWWLRRLGQTKPSKDVAQP